MFIQPYLESLRQGSTGFSQNPVPLMEYPEHVRMLAKLRLSRWESAPQIMGACLILIAEPAGLEVEVRSVGDTPEIDTEQFRENLRKAAATKKSGWNCEPSGFGYPLWHDGTLMGLCILFPEEGVGHQEQWATDVFALSMVLGPLYLGLTEEPPPLDALAETIPPDSLPPTAESARLHWEQSKARVEVPVHEDLAVHLLVDRMPLF